MAGPTSSILLNAIPSELAWVKIRHIILKISNKVEGNDFWVTSTKWINGTVENIEGRPFGLEGNKISSNYYEYPEDEILAIKDLTDFDPQYDLGIYAMGNREVDHRILGELTLYLAEEFGGLIDFGGKLPVKVNKMKGTAWEIPYKTSLGNRELYHLANVGFMKDWLSKNGFKMIK